MRPVGPDADRWRGGSVLSRPSRVQGGPAQDVVLGDLDLLQAERAERLYEEHSARDDRRCAVGVQAGDVTIVNDDA